MLVTAQNQMTEWSFSSNKTYEDPFTDLLLDVIVTDTDGQELRVPAFWSGEHEWRVRYASPKLGTHRWRTECSDASNNDLHGKEGVVEVVPYEGQDPLLNHGPLRVSRSRRNLEHIDGTPFFWLGDTWWMGLCSRLSWPGDFQTLTADRVGKGFTVVQIVGGLYPDMPWRDPRGRNEAGYPWDERFVRINPSYFDMADLRIHHLVKSGLVPCIFGCWGYFLPLMGLEAMKHHWRYLVARFGAYPVVWSLAGEATMPYYLSEQQDRDGELQKKGWTELARYIRQIDPYRHPLTIHPTAYGHDQVQDPSVLDIDMLQTGHHGYRSLANTVDMVSESLTHEPKMPVLVGEVNYEGMLDSSREEAQRFLFWSCMLSGAAGHTYGANGIWQVNTRGKPYGPSPHGTSWGDTPWEEAYQLPGSGQLGLGKRLLERYPWWQFESRPEWVEPHHNEGDRQLAYAAGIPGKVRVIFVPAEATWLAWRGEMTITRIEADVQYRAFYFNPKTGQEHDLGEVASNTEGDYLLPKPPIFQDWVVVLEATRE